jgi:hypothetical protein
VLHRLRQALHHRGFEHPQYRVARNPAPMIRWGPERRVPASASLDFRKGNGPSRPNVEPGVSF